MTTFVKRTDVALASAHTLPGRYFTDPAIFAEELEKIFSSRWLCAGREDQIARPGAYFLRQIGLESIIVLRNRAGEVRAFYNVCRHRGTRLCEEHQGQLAGTIQCPYHAWTYTLDGELTGAPSADSIEDFDKSEWPLHRVAVATWEGFIFISLAARARAVRRSLCPGARPLLAIQPARASGVSPDQLQPRVQLEARGPELLRVLPLPAGAPGARQAVPAHQRRERPVPGSLPRRLHGHRGHDREHDDVGRLCGVPVGDLPAEDHRRVYYYSLFPNLLLSLHPDYVMYHMLWPKDPGHVAIECEWLVHPDTLDNPDYDPNDGVEFWHMTNQQDWHICEQSYRGIESRAYTPGPYSRREGLSAAFDQEVLRSLGHRSEW